MKERIKNNPEAKFVSIFIVVIIIAVIAVFIGNAIHNASAAKNEEPIPIPSEDTLPETVEVPEFEELYTDRNVDETQIIVKIPEGVDPYYRSEPVVDESTVIGTVKAGQSMNVRHVYAVTTENEGKVLWVGVQRAELQLEAQYTQEKTIKSDSDQIVWINGAYAVVYLRDHDPGESDKMDAKYYTRYNSGEYRIIVSDCALRSTPDTSNQYNMYGKFKTTSYIYTDIVYENTVNTFYGVPANAIDNKYLEDRVGDPANDPDGIVWFSVDYVDFITEN